MSLETVSLLSTNWSGRVQPISQYTGEYLSINIEQVDRAMRDKIKLVFFTFQVS